MLNWFYSSLEKDDRHDPLNEVLNYHFERQKTIQCLNISLVIMQ